MLMDRSSAVLDTANEAVGRVNGSYSWSVDAAPAEYVHAVNAHATLAMRISALSLVTDELSEPADALYEAFEPALTYLHAQIRERERSGEGFPFDLRDLEFRMMRVAACSGGFTVAARRLIRETGMPKRRVRESIVQLSRVRWGHARAWVRRVRSGVRIS
ncbi:hypothetical protein AXK60_02030 [Tsukamurella pseudospumae]|uniref:Uncharacterized protein n=2 Tax=Tsukamurella pseudospumae TaxID=239498 RepID=A0A138AW76_9ACTN|nr:hypothetical protein AXK60_02030 [Tsukamurella pseudospumae]